MADDWVNGLTDFNRDTTTAPLSTLTAPAGTSIIRVPGWAPFEPTEYIRASIQAVNDGSTTAILTCATPKRTQSGSTSTTTRENAFYPTTCNPEYPATLIYGPFGAIYSLAATGEYSSGTIWTTSRSCDIGSQGQTCTATESLSVTKGGKAPKTTDSRSWTAGVSTGTLTITAGQQLLASPTTSGTVASAPAATTSSNGSPTRLVNSDSKSLGVQLLVAVGIVAALAIGL